MKRAADCSVGSVHVRVAMNALSMATRERFYEESPFFLQRHVVGMDMVPVGSREMTSHPQTTNRKYMYNHQNCIFNTHITTNQSDLNYFLVFFLDKKAFQGHPFVFYKENCPQISSKRRQRRTRLPAVWSAQAIRSFCACAYTICTSQVIMRNFLSDN